MGRELLQWLLESFTGRKLLVFGLGDSDVKYNHRVGGAGVGWGSQAAACGGDDC